MKYISEEEIIQSWCNLIDSQELHHSSLNKFFGLIELIKNISLQKNEKINPAVQYKLRTSDLSASLQEKYYFDKGLQQFKSDDLLYVLFPNHWKENVLKYFLKGKSLLLKNVAVICLQNTPFPDSANKSDLKALFKEKYHLADAASVLFDDDKSDIEFSNVPPKRNNIFSALKRKYRLTDGGNFTLAFDKKIFKANPGELTRGPFIQPLYSGQENLNCILLSPFNLVEQYTILDQTPTQELQTKNPEGKIPLNQILYGPPGTGKTYNAISKALSITNPNFAARSRSELKMEYDRLIAEGKIGFITFHQSMSYEDFIEGIKPDLTGEQDGDVNYVIKEGIFKIMCRNARMPIIAKNNFEEAYKSLLKEIKENDGKVVLETLVRSREFTIYENTKGNIRFHANTEKAYEGTIKKSVLEHYLKTGEELDWPSYTRSVGKYIVDKHHYSQTVDSSNGNVVLIIDEINRGNVSSIFGELITLIEDDKRENKAESLKALLPYSKEYFSVPSNLYIVGTMNTADRSVEALDTALRRRFSFFEYQSDSGLLKQNIADLNISYGEILTTINLRIEKLLDKDHVIGHAYFIQLLEGDMESLKRVFADKVLPLLQEYFFGDLGKIGLVLGKDFLREAKGENEQEIFANFEYPDAGTLSEKQLYRLVDINALSENEFTSAIKTLMNHNNGA